MVPTEGFKQVIADHDVLIANYDIIHGKLQDALQAVAWDVVILDEAQYLKKKTSRRSKEILGFQMNRKNGVCRNACRVWLLSGTPITDTPADLWPVLHALFPDCTLMAGRNGKPLGFWQFAHRYCDVEHTGFGQKITGGRKLGELADALRDIMLVKQTVPGLKPHRHGEIVVAAEDTALLAAIEAMEEARAVRDNLVFEDWESAEIGLATLRERLALAKAAPLVSFLRDELEDGDHKIVVFAHHRAALEYMAEAFGPVAVELHGGTSATNRQAAIERFQTDPACRVFLGQIFAAGDSITLDAAEDIVFLERDWLPTNNAQAEARCDNARDGRSVMIRTCVLAESVDEHVLAAQKRRAAVIGQVIREEGLEQ